MVDLKGKNAIVTGAAVGIGNAYAKALAAKGVNVAVCDVREEIDNLPGELEALGVRSVGWRGDVSVPADVRRVVDGAKEAFGSIDILVNNAGIIGPTVPDDPLDKTLADYELIVGTNLKGEYLFGRAAIPIMLEQGTGGEIVNLSTDHLATCGAPRDLCPQLSSCTFPHPRPTSGGDGMDLYDSSKWGLSGLTLAWAKELRPHNIRVNALCMGATDSYMLRSFYNFEAPESEIATWMKTSEAAQVLTDLLEEGPKGRTGENMNFCVGRPCKLEPAQPALYILEEDINVSA